MTPGDRVYHLGRKEYGIARGEVRRDGSVDVEFEDGTRPVTASLLVPADEASSKDGE